MSRYTTCEELLKLVTQATVAWRNYYSPSEKNTPGEEILDCVGQIAVVTVMLAMDADRDVALTSHVLFGRLKQLVLLTLGSLPGGIDSFRSRLSNLGEE